MFETPRDRFIFCRHRPQNTKDTPALWGRSQRYRRSSQPPSGVFSLALFTVITLVNTLALPVLPVRAQDPPPPDAPTATTEAPLRRLDPADVGDRQARYALLRDNRLWQDR